MIISSNFFDGGYSTQYDMQKSNQLIEGLLNYSNAETAENHRLDLTAGYSFQEWSTLMPSYPVLSEAGDTTYAAGLPTDTRNALLSYYSRGIYSFKDKYILTDSKEIKKIAQTSQKEFSNKSSKDILKLLKEKSNSKLYPSRILNLGIFKIVSNSKDFKGKNESEMNNVITDIFKELNYDLSCEIPKSGDLTQWTQEGVLLLNASLTVRQSKSNSHYKYWQELTDNLIKFISNEKENVIFVLWGNFAKQKKQLINTINKHHILESAHPSPLSASRGGWFGNNHFSKINNILKNNNKEIINWDSII